MLASTDALPLSTDVSDDAVLPCWSDDPDLWFAERPADVEAAKALCVPCPLRAECLAGGGWWFHLRRCAQCGHVGCCDSSPAQHATAHWKATGHPVVQSYEPGEEWFWDYGTEQAGSGPALAPPVSHPADQSAPGPAGAVQRP